MLVLFVDDDPDDYEIFCQGLKECHPEARCLHAVDGEAAIALLKKLTDLPDYIFMDINMPRMNGQECLTIIKGNSKLKQIPVVMYSTSANLIEINVLKASGAKDFIIKPSTIKELANILKSVLQ